MQHGDQAGIAFALSNVGSLPRTATARARSLRAQPRDVRSRCETAMDRPRGLQYRPRPLRQGNDAQALEHFQRSMQMFAELGDQDGIARSLDAIGSVYSREGRYAEALDSLRQALTKRQGLGDKRGITGSLVNIGEVYVRQGDYTNAAAYADNASRMSSDLGGKEDIVRTQILVATIDQKRRRYTEALTAAEHAAAVAQQISSLDALASAKLIAGTAYRALQQPASARLAFEEAISAVERMRLQVAGGEQDRQAFFELNVSPYQAMAELLVVGGKPAEALTYAERARARVLLDVLASGRVNITKAMTRGERERERDFNGQLVSLNTQIVRESLRPQPDPRRVAELQGRLRATRLDLEAFRTNLYAAHPELRVERADIRPLMPDNADSLLTDDRTALLEFLLGEEQSLLFVLTRQATVDLEVYTLPIGRKDLGDRVGRFRQMLAALDNRFSRPARELYDLLIAPAAAQLRGRTRLVIVPDGPLWELPFHALLSGRDRYVIDVGASSTCRR